MINFVKNKEVLIFVITLGLVLIFSTVPYALGYGPANNDIVENGKEELPGENSEEDTEAAEETELTEEEKMQLIKEERLAREQALKEELGSLFVPLPPLEQEPNPKVKARALYLTGHSVGLESRYRNILSLVDETELNALVIDVKDDHGRLTYNSEIEYVKDIGSEYSPPPIRDLKATVDELHKKGIYTIARVVIFKDPYLADRRHDLAIQRADGGGAWRDNRGVAWVNPYKQEVWDYNIAVAREAALAGFREIQFDYIRFPENAKHIESHVYYPGGDYIEKDDIIAEVIKYARQELDEYNVHLAADVFGVISTSWGDSDRIGQTWEKVSPLLDYICPMIYPSHYGPGYFGFSVPDANPKGTVKRALEDSIKRNAALEEPGIIRPWLQSFTASWVRGSIPYGAREVRQQIDAAIRLGIDEYMLWNAGNVYPEDAFYSYDEAERRIREAEAGREEKGHDDLGRTPSDALEVYIDAIRGRDWREAYPLHNPGFPFVLDEIENYKDWLNSIKYRPVSYDILSVSRQGDEALAELSIILKHKDDEIKLENEEWSLVIINDVWQVRPSSRFLNGLDRSTFQENATE